MSISPRFINRGFFFMSKTVVVAIDQSLDNYAVLGNRLRLMSAEDVIYDIYIHNDPMANQDNTGLRLNFDILIDGGYGRKDWADILPKRNHHHRPRFTKDIQALKLAAEYKNWLSMPENRLRNFIPIPTWSVGWNGRNYPVTDTPVVVKSLDGARGIGQFVVKTEHVNLNYFLSELKYTLSQELVDDTVPKFLERFEGNVIYGGGDENYVNEGLVTMRDQGYFVQSLVPDVKVEYRIITDTNSVPKYFQRRKVRDVDSAYPQATGSGSVVDKEAILTAEAFYAESNVSSAFFEHVCRTVIGPLSSIDVFITSGEWGIFEYCNQFGISGIPAATVTDLHKEHLLKVIQGALENV